jgi:ADP-heptose:LPS heptosyltransferase
MIIISPWSRNLRTGGPSPKNYPHWEGLIKLLKGYNDIIQIGSGKEPKLVSSSSCVFNLPLDELASKYIMPCSFWVSVDNFLQHMCYHLKKPGVVIWGPSDPTIFGYQENLNILKDRSYLRPNQFVFWEQCVPDRKAFLKPHEIIDQLKVNGLLK